MAGSRFALLLTAWLGIGAAPLPANDTSVAPDGMLATADEQTKKELVAAVRQLRIDQEILEKAEKAWQRGLFPEAFLLNAQRNVSQSQEAVVRVVKTLRLRGMSTADIQVLQREAEKQAKQSRAK
jgi:hypothetical protein